MPEIERLAAFVVWRGFGFCWLAITMAMSGLIFDLSLACRVGALLALILALVLQFRANTYHRIRRIDETEVWILLDERVRPTKEAARALIVPAMRLELSEKALYAAVMGGGLFLLSVVLRLLLAG
jgi:hypothetical protein